MTNNQKAALKVLSLYSRSVLVFATEGSLMVEAQEAHPTAEYDDVSTRFKK
jgi:hypothetical protein